MNKVLKLFRRRRRAASGWKENFHIGKGKNPWQEVTGHPVVDITVASKEGP